MALKIFKRKNHKRNKEAGASLVEYGLLVALVAVVAIPAVTSTGEEVSCIFEVANAGLNAPSGTPFDAAAARADCGGSDGGGGS